MISVINHLVSVIKLSVNVIFSICIMYLFIVIHLIQMQFFCFFLEFMEF